MDTTIFRWINNLAGHVGWLDSMMKFYASNGVVLFAVLLVVAFLDGRRRSSLTGVASAIWAGAAPLLALVVALVVGGWVNRTRPYTTLANVHLLLDKTTDFSFPSDHATTVSAVAAALLIGHRRIGLVAAVGAVLMAFARVYSGVHYPGDVAAGLTLGTVVAVVGSRFAVPLITKLLGRLVKTPVRPLLTTSAPVSGT
jgi:membrane-associated phospholipid phosphatase